MDYKDILLVEDDAPLADAIQEAIKLAGLSVHHVASAEEALVTLDTLDVNLIVSDLNLKKMSGTDLLSADKIIARKIPVIIITAFGSVKNAVDAIKNGAKDYILKPFKANDLISLINKYKRNDGEDSPTIISESMEKIYVKAKQVAKTNASVMITGESGTGKEVLARYIHKNSDRSDKPFVAINCAAIPDNMLEATLFGYEKGAFTGAQQAYAGKFEQANHGTLLLDEITEMDIGLQAKLLRVLQESEVERIGGKKIIQLDVRIISTSNRNLHDEVNKKGFREDLFYRLNVFPLMMKPLRERIDDIVALSNTFISKYSSGNYTFSQAAVSKILSYDWPGNVRELENVIQRAIILSIGNTIDENSIVIDDGETNNSNDTSSERQPTDNLSSELRDKEFDVIKQCLAKHSGNRTKVAKELGISTRTLRYKLAKMRELGIAIPSFTAA